MKASYQLQLFLHSILNHHLEIMDSYSSTSAEIVSESQLSFTIYAKAVFHHAFTNFVLKTGIHSRESCNFAQHSRELRTRSSWWKEDYRKDCFACSCLPLIYPVSQDTSRKSYFSSKAQGIVPR